VALQLQKIMLCGKKVIVSKYGANSSGWWSKRSPYAHEVGCWKSIRAMLDFFKSLVCFEARVLFWHHKVVQGAVSQRFQIFLEWHAREMQ